MPLRIVSIRIQQSGDLFLASGSEPVFYVYVWLCQTHVLQKKSEQMVLESTEYRAITCVGDCTVGRKSDYKYAECSLLHEPIHGLRQQEGKCWRRPWLYKIYLYIYLQ